MAMQLQDLVGNVKVLEPVNAGNLQVFGLRWSVPQPLEYVTLDEALTGTGFEVTEVSEGGSVPTLLVTNNLEQHVFLMAGEHLRGAKQNRVLNVSLLVAAKSRIPVPVSCVESGRWGYRSPKFYGSGSSSHGYLRKMMSVQALEGYRVRGAPTSKQGEVWHEVNRKLDVMGSFSPSHALEQAYQDHHQRLHDMLAQVRLPDDCAGVVFAFGGRIAGVDLFDKPATLRRLLPKLVSAYALDALEEPAPASIDRAAVETWLQGTRAASLERFKSPGLGDDVRIVSRDAVGASLVVDDCPVHVELYPGNGDERGQGAPRPTPPAGTTVPASPRPAPAAEAAGGPQATARPARPSVLALATSESILAALSQATERLEPVFAEVGAAIRRSGRLIRVQPTEQDRCDGSNPTLSPAEEEQLVRQAVARSPGNACRVVFAGCGLADRWFSHWHPESCTAVVSLQDWACVSALPPTAFVACELVLHGWRAASPRYDPERLVHAATRGCLFDFCADKAAINAKLQSGVLCFRCRWALRRRGVDTKRLRRALAVVRELARGNPVANVRSLQDQGSAPR